MCGIAGILRFDGAAPDRGAVTAMTAALAHRGPDGSGVVVDAHVGLGHRRLAIIDREGGAQPMALSGRDITITYNGEVYNHDELRRRLVSRGFAFRTRSDTEVILAAYDAWGEACVDHLRGMYAFAIADGERRRMFLARDPIGIKPLVYALSPRRLVFASELEALLLGLGAEDQPRVRLGAIDLFLRYGYIPAPHTIYQGVHKLLPGHTLTVDYGSGAGASPRRFFDFRFRPAPTSASKAEWCERVDTAIHDSVRAHLVADVPVGAFLSGGVDSTLVSACMAETVRDRFRAYTIGFREQRYSEVPFAEEAASRLNIALDVELLGEEALRELPRMVHHCGEPFGDSSIVATWAVSRLAASRGRVVLSGDGGDELFGGYHSYIAFLDSAEPPRAADVAAYAARALRARLGRAPSSARVGARQLARNAVRFAVHGRRDALALFDSLVWIFPDDERLTLWRPEHQPHALLEHSLRVARALAGEAAREAEPLSFAQRLDLGRYLPSDVLTKVDIASMAHGLEVRPPLLDPAVWAIAAELPRSLRMGPGRVTKPALKELLLRRTSAAHAHRSKMGFALPVVDWLRPGRPGHDLLIDALSGSEVGALFHPSAVQALLARQGAGEDVSARLWQLFVLGLWLREHRGFGLCAGTS